MKTVCIALLFAVALCGQEKGPSAPGTRPQFVATDVHAARADESILWTRPLGDPRSSLLTLPVREGIFEVKGATMLDLIATAYGWGPEKIVGGPNWLEMDRFDITAKVAGEASTDDKKLMLQRLLEERFRLAVHQATKPVPGYALTAGQHPALRKATGSEKSGCVPFASPTPSSMDMSFNTYGPNPIHYTLGPGSTVTYNCRNVTMSAFAQGLQAMIGANLNPGPVLDATGLKGAWNFDLHWTQHGVHLDRLPPGHVRIFDALDQQLGLKLEERLVPAPALVVDSVNQTPTPNAPDLTRLMPRIPAVTRFEVASVKPVDPHSAGRDKRQIEPRRLTIENFPMRYLFDMALPSQTIEKMPDWAETTAFNIMATTPAGFASLNAADLATPMLALLKDRFRLTYHTEQRPRPAYVIEAMKPGVVGVKLKKADPARRASCRRDTAPSGEQGYLTRFTCQNVTMGQFAEWFSDHGIGLKFWANGITVVSDSTGLSGAWDFTLLYDPVEWMAPTDDQSPTAGDPGGGYTLVEAMQRQLGLKLVTTTKPGPVIVIDRLDQKPTEQ